ncbi:MAG: hypothetical protein E7017_00980 [Alphaproteobacteria bacterium]|nr:hypothetical protein [Alphaproteobacteria bacterium]
MMKISKEQSLRFLKEVQGDITSKNQIFDALFEACGTGEKVNTKHIFFQEVIIKFNASKAVAVITNKMPYETESHYVDVAIYAYIKAGFDMKDFEKDLNEYKIRYECLCASVARGIPDFANA